MTRADKFRLYCFIAVVAFAYGAVPTTGWIFADAPAGTGVFGGVCLATALPFLAQAWRYRR